MTGGGPVTGAEIIDELRRQGLTIAVAESLSGGLLVAELIKTAGASDVVRGGVVAYATDVKRSVLGVDAAQLEATGPVDAEVARQMAIGVRRVLAHEGIPADIGISTTGVAGPGPQDDHPAGTVYIGLAIEDSLTSHRLQLAGNRDTIRALTVEAALGILWDGLRS